MNLCMGGGLEMTFFQAAQGGSHDKGPSFRVSIFHTPKGVEEMLGSRKSSSTREAGEGFFMSDMIIICAQVAELTRSEAVQRWLEGRGRRPYLNAQPIDESLSA
jgi:hypothetical protein